MAPFLLPAVAGAILTVATSVVGRVITALGMGIVSYTGVNAGLTYFRTVFDANASAGGSVLAGMLGTLQLDLCLSIFIGAGLAKLALAGASSGVVKKLVMK